METTTLKSPQEEPEPNSPNPIQPAKPLSFSNGVLKLRTPHAPPHEPHAPYSSNTYNVHIKPHAPAHAPGTYMECLKNHAAAIGGNAVDGCGEYMPSAASLLCAACGCHRNFHRLSPRAAVSPHAPPQHLPLLEYRPHRRHRPLPPRLSPSPPPISSSYMLLSLSSPNPNNNHKSNYANPNGGSNSKKRFRTRFTLIQKEKMYELAERLTWKMQRRDEEMISGFCEKIGVEKGVFKVWMHNNKNSRGKKETVSVNGVVSKGNGINLDDYRDRDDNSNSTDEVSGHHVGTNGSSCS